MIRQISATERKLTMKEEEGKEPKRAEYRRRGIDESTYVVGKSRPRSSLSGKHHPDI